MAYTVNTLLSKKVTKSQGNEKDVCSSFYIYFLLKTDKHNKCWNIIKNAQSSL